MATFTVIKKTAGYGVKSFASEAAAKAYAAACCKANHNSDYIVCVYAGGIYQQI